MLKVFKVIIILVLSITLSVMLFACDKNDLKEVPEQHGGTYQEEPAEKDVLTDGEEQDDANGQEEQGVKDEETNGNNTQNGGNTNRERDGKWSQETYL